MLRIEFKTDTAGFQYSDGDVSMSALSDVLKDIGQRLENYHTDGIIRDGNGVNVGSWSYTREDD